VTQWVQQAKLDKLVTYLLIDYYSVIELR